MNGKFAKEEIQMVNKHRKKTSFSHFQDANFANTIENSLLINIKRVNAQHSKIVGKKLLGYKMT